MNRKPKVSKENLQTAKRLLKYVTGTYKVRFVIVFICILLSSIASISVSLSLKFLIDDFISPLIGQKDPNFAELYRALAVLGSIPIITYDLIGFEGHTIFILPTSYMDIKHSGPNIPSLQYRCLSANGCYDDIGICHGLRIIASAGDKMNIRNYFIKFGYESVFGCTVPGSNFAGSDRWEEMFQQCKVHPKIGRAHV